MEGVGERRGVEEWSVWERGGRGVEEWSVLERGG